MKPTAEVFKGDNGRWGVTEIKGAVIYESDFSKAVARRIVQLENAEKPPEDWEETAEILEAEGYKV